MAENDIYNSQGKYERFLSNLDKLLEKPKRVEGRRGIRKYWCKNKDNLKHFRSLHEKFEARDTSYVRRLRLFNSLIFITSHTRKELSNLLDRKDFDRIVAVANNVFKSEKTRVDFKKDIKFLWKQLFPELDSENRPDETITPYIVRHLKTTEEKSKKKGRKDRLTVEEFERIVSYFKGDLRIQAYLMLAMESLARPQELMYLRIGNVEVFDSYAKIYVTEHGKEGAKLIQCIDSFPFVQKWLSRHPDGSNKDAFLFTTNCGNKQLTPYNLNKKLRTACKNLAIDKPVTSYSLKRNGVTFRRLRGEDDLDIQHAAGWTSAKQLSTYDMTTQEDAFVKKLVERGKIDNKSPVYEKIIHNYSFTEKICSFCGEKSPFNEQYCTNPSCVRPLDRERINQQRKTEGMIDIKELAKQFVGDQEAMNLFRRKLAEIGNG